MAWTPKRLIVSSGSPDPLNTNAYLRGYVAHGFRELLAETEVDNVAYEGLQGAIEGLKPDAVLVFGSVMLGQSDFDRVSDTLRQRGAPLWFWLHDDPYEFDANNRIFELTDHIFTNDLATLIHYPPTLPVTHLPLAACPPAHYREVTRRSAPDWFFCGAAYENRSRFFSELNERMPELEGQILGAGWDQGKLPMASNIRMPNDTLPDFYAKALSVANVGRTHNLANNRYRIRPSTPGPRTFEAGLAGAAQIMIQPSMELLDAYEADSEVLIADSPQDYAEHLARLKSEPGLSESLGRAAQKRTQAEHCYRHRAESILKAVR